MQRDQLTASDAFAGWKLVPFGCATPNTEVSFRAKNGTALRSVGAMAEVNEGLTA